MTDTREAPELERLRLAKAEYVADPVDNRDRASSWAKLDAMLKAIDQALRAPAVQGERMRAALRVAGQMVDGVNGVDLHDAAYDRYVERTGDVPCERGEPSEDDYADAFMEAALHTPTESER